MAGAEAVMAGAEAGMVVAVALVAGAEAEAAMAEAAMVQAAEATRPYSQPMRSAAMMRPASICHRTPQVLRLRAMRLGVATALEAAMALAAKAALEAARRRRRRQQQQVQQQQVQGRRVGHSQRSLASMGWASATCGTTTRSTSW